MDLYVVIGFSYGNEIMLDKDVVYSSPEKALEKLESLKNECESKGYKGDLQPQNRFLIITNKNDEFVGFYRIYLRALIS